MQAHVPERLMRKSNMAKKISPHILPLPQQAANEYRLNGGTITDPDQDVTDPLFNNSEKIEIRHRSFINRYPSFDIIFQNLVNGESCMFKNGLKFFIDLTFRLSC